MSEIFKYLHIITMFSAVATSVGVEFLLHRVAASGDVRSIRNVFKLAEPFGKAVPILFIVGMLFGLTTAYFKTYNFFANWLLLAYTIFAINLVVGGAISGPWLGRTALAAADSPDDKPSPELEALIHDRNATVAMWVAIVSIISIVFVMVMKPFS